MLKQNGAFDRDARIKQLIEMRDRKVALRKAIADVSGKGRPHKH